MTKTHFHPLATWLVLAAAIASLFPLPVQFLTVAWLIALTSLIITVLSRHDLPLLIATAGIPALALLLPLPLPEWPTVPRLLLILGVWFTLLTIATTLATVYTQTHDQSKK